MPPVLVLLTVSLGSEASAMPRSAPGPRLAPGIFMGKQEHSAWSRLSRELRGLERVAADAVVPGELRTWCEPVAESLARVGERMRDYGGEEHALRQQMLGEDLELAHRIDRLSGEFCWRSAELARLERTTRQLLDADLEAPAASAEPTAGAQRLREEVLRWIIELKAHHGEVGTFFQEALHRDRGVVD